MKDLTADCYKKSIELLVKNSGRYGLAAATSGVRAKQSRYHNIFARDACVSSLGMIASGDKKLLAIVKKSLKTLAKYQTKLGQIPYSVNPNKNEVNFYFLGSIDSTLWWLLAVDFYNKRGNDKELFKQLRPKIKKALNWLFFQDQNNCGLLEQGEASDWADLMPANGSVLYTNVLWFKVLSIYGFKKEKKLARDGLNSLFLPHEANIKKSKFLKGEIHRLKLINILKKKVKKTPYYLNYVSSFYGNDRCDVYGNLLTVLFGVADKNRTDKIINYLIKNKVNKFYPIKALSPAVKKGDFDWRDYFRHNDLNLPNQYHNGGIWPYVGGFWVTALAKAGKKNLARRELEKLAMANKVNNWQFNEWFHGQTGKPMGMAGQSWNAGMFLFAYHYLNEDMDI